MPRALLTIGAFAVCFLTLQLITVSRISATWDEPAHLTAGYAALQGDYRIDPAHPPFARMWAALPLLFQDGVSMDRSPIDAVSGVAWVSDGHAYVFARDFMYGRNDGDRMLFAARLMIVALGLLLGILVFAWAYEWLGFKAAAIALALFLVSPNLTGHASLVTTDLAVTCFGFGAVYFLWRTCRSFTRLNVGGTAAFFALAIVTKFSAVLLVPAALGTLALAVHGRAITWRRAAAVAGVAAAVTYAAIWAVYGFRYAPAPDGWLLHLEAASHLRGRAPVTAAIVEFVDAWRLLPNAFSQGLLLLQYASDANPAYLAGDISVDGWWYYFPFAFLIKTPLAKIGLVAAGLWIGARSMRGRWDSPFAFIVIPATAFVAFAMLSGFNIGMRHILPALPFTLLLATAGARTLLLSPRPAARLVLAALLAFSAVEYARAYPHPLTFFNQLVGGPENGYRYLADSNLGWGQQLKPLKEWMADNGVDHVNLAYFGQADPDYYGIPHVMLPGSSVTPESPVRPRLPGYVAVSGTVLTGVYLHPAWRLFYRPFFDMEPTAILGNSMRVFWVDRWPVAQPSGSEESGDFAAALALGDALINGLRWPELAVDTLQAAVAARPNAPAATNLLGVALAQTGRLADAEAVFRRAVELQPGAAEPRKNLSLALFKQGEAEEAVYHLVEAARLAPGDAMLQNLLAQVTAGAEVRPATR
ncbi:MAG: tetratricopeptide repeat protein [Vicinamibacterales bacterium]